MDAPSRVLVAFYWGPRPWSLDESARNLLQVFSALRSAGFETFRRKGGSRKKAEASHFEPTPESVSSLLARGANRRDIGREIIVELGFSFGLWSGGKEDDAYQLTGLFGASTDICSNNLLLELATSGPYAFAVAEQQVRALFPELVRILSPRDAIVCNADAISWTNRRLAADIPCFIRYANGV